MYRFVIFVGVVAVGAHARCEDMPVCARVSRDGLKCCKKELPPIGPPTDDIKECFKLMKKPPSCEVEKCIAKKKGIVSDDGTFNKKMMTEDVEQKFESDAELADRLKENCINGDLSKYGPADLCDLVKQKVCFEVQIIKSCDWDEEGDCSGMKDLAMECIEQFS